MAVRRLILDAILLPDGQPTGRPLTMTRMLKTHMKRYWSCNVVYDERPHTLYYMRTAYLRPNTSAWPDLNHYAMELADDPTAVFPFRQGLVRCATAGRECIIGPALLVPQQNKGSERYARVVTLSEDADWTVDDFDTWAELNFQGDPWPVGLVGDYRNTYAYCEDPDPKARDIKLTTARLRFG